MAETEYLLPGGRRRKHGDKDKGLGGQENLRIREQELGMCLGLYSTSKRRMN